MDPYQFWITSIVFTVVGYYFGQDNVPMKHIKRIAAETIEHLIEQGYIKTRGIGDDQELLKYYEDI